MSAGVIDPILSWRSFPVLFVPFVPYVLFPAPFPPDKVDFSPPVGMLTRLFW